MRPLLDVPLWQTDIAPDFKDTGEAIDFTDLEDMALWREASDALGLDFQPLDSDGVQYL